MLLPLSWIYCALTWLRYKCSVEKEYGIAVIGIGNLTVGGSGKSPLAIAIASQFEGAAIVLRGYGRKSTGMHVVERKAIDEAVIAKYGDEALMLAHALPGTEVIVSEDRVLGIKEAKRLGARYVILDDAYSKHAIKKFELLIMSSNVKNSHCLPAGPFRERRYKDKHIREIIESRDFFRTIESVEDIDECLLVSGIAKPERLLSFLPKTLPFYFFEDHHRFTKEELEKLLRTHQKRVLLVTLKDFVKIVPFNLPVQILHLHIELSKVLKAEIQEYLKESIAT